MNKKIVYLDMDGVLSNFWASVKSISEIDENPWDPPEMFEPGFWRNLKVMPGAIEGVKALMDNPALDVYIASKPTSKYLGCASEKYEWINEHFPTLVRKIFLICDKGHLNGDYLIDDDYSRWKPKFPGKFIWFYEDNPEDSWAEIIKYFDKTYTI